jgi:hypothetical protein
MLCLDYSFYVISIWLGLFCMTQAQAAETVDWQKVMGMCNLKQGTLWSDKVEDTEEVNRNRNSKDRHYNDKEKGKQNKQTNNYLQTLHRQLMIEQHTPHKIWVNSYAPAG